MPKRQQDVVKELCMNTWNGHDGWENCWEKCKEVDIICNEYDTNIMNDINWWMMEKVCETKYFQGLHLFLKSTANEKTWNLRTLWHIT